MDLEHHYRHKQHAFDAFCKGPSEMSLLTLSWVRVQQDRFVSLSDLPGGGQRGACDL